MSWIQDIVVVVAKENVDQMSDIVQRFGHRKVRVVTGGSTRHRSIRNGVQALAEDRPEVVLIHDAVRPFLEEDFVHQIALAAKEHGVSAPRAKLSLSHFQMKRQPDIYIFYSANMLFGARQLKNPSLCLATTDLLARCHCEQQTWRNHSAIVCHLLCASVVGAGGRSHPASGFHCDRQHT